MKWKKLTSHQKEFRVKFAIFFLLGSWFAIQSMGVRDYLTLAFFLGIPIGLAYLYDYIKKRKYEKD